MSFLRPPCRLVFLPAGARATSQLATHTHIYRQHTNPPFELNADRSVWPQKGDPLRTQSIVPPTPPSYGKNDNRMSFKRKGVIFNDKDIKVSM